MSGLNDDAHAIFEAQHGAAGRFQLVDLLTEPTVDGLAQRGRIVVIERGVYGVAGGAPTRERAAMAALLRARPDARLTGRFVLGVTGMEGFDADDPFTVLTAPGRRMRGVSFDHRPDPISDRRTVSVGALTCVHPQVAFIDAIETMETRQRRVVLHVLKRRGSWSDRRLDEELAARPDDDPGVLLVRQLVDEGALQTDSAEEDALGRRLRSIDDRFEPQVWITPKRRVDWFLRWARLGFEYQGEVDHAHVAGRLRDEAKADEASAVGVRIIPVVAADLRTDGFEDWVRGLIATRAFELGRATA